MKSAPREPRAPFGVLLATLLPAGATSGQQLVWEVPAAVDRGFVRCAPFGDFDRDGARDLLARRNIAFGTPQQRASICVVSGRTGAILDEFVPSPVGADFAPAGDFDGDGFDEYTWTLGFTVHVHSPRRRIDLLSFPATGPGDFGSVSEARVDLDGDGLSDILIATVRSFDSTLYAYDHTGAPLYTIPASVSGWEIQSVAGIGDRDGDGGDDFLVGAVDATQTGAVFLYSGRTGAPLRFHPGAQPFDYLGGYVAAGGDLDGDGVDDYVASTARNPFALRQVTTAWSGATGVELRSWIDTAFQTGVVVSAAHDADLDGLADVVFACPACIVQPPSLFGRVRVASARDGALLADTHPTTAVSNYGDSVADLGVQPGNPHPLYATTFQAGGSPYGVLQAWRVEPPSASLSGAACANFGPQLAPGLRSTPTGSRLQLATATPGALAWCVLGDGVATTTGGVGLPVALDPLGFLGCSLLVPIDFVGATVTGAVGVDRGYAAFDLPRMLAASGGARFAVQWFVADPATGTYAWTWRLDFRLQ